MLVFPAYKDLQTREDIRNAAWHKPGWDELVYYTGNPLTPLECWGQTLGCATLSAPQHIPLGEKLLYLGGNMCKFQFSVYNGAEEHCTEL